MNLSKNRRKILRKRVENQRKERKKIVDQEIVILSRKNQRNSVNKNFQIKIYLAL